MEKMDKIKQMIPNDPDVISKKYSVSSSASNDRSAAIENIDNEQMVEIWARRAADLAAPPLVKAEGTTLDLLIFRQGGERYGLKVNHVVEIYPPEQITPVPRTPDFVVGVFSARGRLLSVVDLRAFFGLPQIGLSDASKIIVVTNDDSEQSSNGQFEVGLLADEVEDVVTIFKDDLEVALSSQMGGRAEHTLGITADMLVVLNLDTLLQNKRLIVHEEV